MSNDTINQGSKDLNLPDTAQKVLTNFQESFLSGELQGGTEQIQQCAPLITRSSSSNMQSTPPPPSSFFLRFYIE